VGELPVAVAPGVAAGDRKIARIRPVDKAFGGSTNHKIICMCESGERRSRADYALLSHAQRVEELAAIQRQRAALDAREARLLHAMHADPVPDLDGTPAADKQWVREDVACVQRIAPQTAAARLSDATELVTRLPKTLAMLERGQITHPHARRLVDAIRPLSGDIVSKIEKRVLARASQQSVGEFAAAVRRAVLALDTRGAEDRHRDAVDGRRVVFTPQADGIVELWAPLPAEGALAAEARLTAEAERLKTLDKQSGSSRTATQRRADALIALLTGASGGQSGAGLKPTVNVTVALSTLLGLDEQPAQLDGYGSIGAWAARAITFDPTGTWRRLVTDEAGRLLDVTATTYRPPAPVARLVRLQQPTCCFPGCGRRAGNCDLDHVVPWPKGPTCAANLQPLCERHHHLKHEAGWRPVKEPDGTTTWTSPSGQTYARPPDQLPRDSTGEPMTEPTADDDPPF
jgi:hypothetical protein